MTDTIRIQLDTVPIYRNSTKHRTVNRARSSLGHEIKGNGPIVSKMAAVLRAENPGFDGQVVVYRGNTLCFKPMPLKSAFLKGHQPEHLRKKTTE